MGHVGQAQLINLDAGEGRAELREARPSYGMLAEGGSSQSQTLATI
jgi:hypothetical protein